MTQEAKNDFLMVKIHSFAYRALQSSINEVIRVVKTTGSRVVGPILLPSRKKRIVVLSSPHVDKDSRDQYRLKLSSRLLYIMDLTDKTVDALVLLELPYGVSIEVRQKVYDVVRN